MLRPQFQTNIITTTSLHVQVCQLLCQIPIVVCNPNPHRGRRPQLLRIPKEVTLLNRYYRPRLQPQTRISFNPTNLGPLHIIPKSLSVQLRTDYPNSIGTWVRTLRDILHLFRQLVLRQTCFHKILEVLISKCSVTCRAPPNPLTPLGKTVGQTSMAINFRNRFNSLQVINNSNIFNRISLSKRVSSIFWNPTFSQFKDRCQRLFQREFTQLKRLIITAIFRETPCTIHQGVTENLVVNICSKVYRMIRIGK